MICDFGMTKKMNFKRILDTVVGVSRYAAPEDLLLEETINPYAIGISIKLNVLIRSLECWSNIR
jgi:serine/threonine protein kinase